MTMVAPPADHRFDAEQHEVLRTAGRAFVRGDSRLVRAYKPWLELQFPVIEISMWAFRDVYVRSGSVLQFGRGIHVLLAHNITIERGGTVRSFGDLTVRASRIERAEGTIAELPPWLVAAQQIGGLVFHPGPPPPDESPASTVIASERGAFHGN